MAGLSSELYNRCRNTLIKCSEFDSSFSLRALFVTSELLPFRNTLPETANKSERVDTVLSFLLDKHLSDGRAVLPLFIAALRDRYQVGDALRDELESLYDQITEDSLTSVASSEVIEVSSLRRQLAQLKSNLLTIEEQSSRFIDPRNIPVDLTEARKLTQKRIKNIESRLAQLGFYEEPSDEESPYDKGLLRLAQLLKAADQSKDQIVLATLEARLRDNIRDVQLFGDTESKRVERVQILQDLNRMALAASSISFNELCGNKDLLASKVIANAQSVYNHMELVRKDIAWTNKLLQENSFCPGYISVPSPSMYFISYEFDASRADDVRRAVESGLKTVNLQTEPYYPQKDTSPELLLCKVMTHIASSSFCLFDLPLTGGTNVFLEIGIAFGLRKPFVLVRPQQVSLPDSLSDLDNEKYLTYTGLGDDLFSRSKITFGRFPDLHTDKAYVSAEFLIAYGGSNSEDFESVVSDVILSRYYLRPLYLSQYDIKGLSDLASCVQRSLFGIFRIDSDAAPDTFIALGLALALNKPILILSREEDEVPELLQNLIHLSFRSFRELKEELPVRAGDFFIRHIDSQSVKNEQMSPRVVRSILEQYFDLEELKTLSQDLGVDFGSLPGESKSAKARELVASLQRRGRLNDLTAAYQRYRPHSLTEIAPSFESQWSNCIKSIITPQEFTKQSAVLLESLIRTLDLKVHEPRAGISYNHLQAFKVDITPVVTDTRLPESLPIVFLRRTELHGEDLTDLRHLLTEKLHISHRIVILIILADQIEPRAIDLLEESDVFAYDIILASRMEILPILTSPNPQRALRRLLFAHTDLVQVSPFVLAGPTPPNMFFGREKEIRTIITAIRDRSIALIGGRRIGKTSILQRVQHLLSKTDSACSPYYLDCQTIENYDDLFTKIRILWPGWDTVETSPNGFVKVVAGLQESNQKPLFLLDEVDQLLWFDNQHKDRLFKAFRSLSQEHKCHFVFSGEKVLIRHSRDSSSPLFNFCDTLAIGYLDQKNARRLLIEPMQKIDIEIGEVEKVVQEVLETTSCHPRLIQYIGHNLIMHLEDKQTRHIDVSDLRQVLTSPDFGEEYMRTIWGDATNLERLITLLIARGYKTSKALLEQLNTLKINPSSEMLKNALSNLCTYPILKQVRRDTYQFTASHFPEFAKTVQDIDLTILGFVDKCQGENLL